MAHFTVVLLRPSSLAAANDVDGIDIYVANRIQAKDKREALALARREAYDADIRDWGERAMVKFEVHTQDYELVVMFTGHHDVCMHSFEERYAL